MESGRGRFLFRGCDVSDDYHLNAPRRLKLTPRTPNCDSRFMKFFDDRGGVARPALDPSVVETRTASASGSMDFSIRDRVGHHEFLSTRHLGRSIGGRDLDGG